MSPGGRISENEKQRHKSQGKVLGTFTAAILWTERDRLFSDGKIIDKFIGDVSEGRKREKRKEEVMRGRDKNK